MKLADIPPSPVSYYYPQAIPQGPADYPLPAGMQRTKSPLALSGEMLMTSPVYALANTPNPLSTLGTVTGLAIVGGVLLLSGYMSYRIGARMAPNQKSRTSYGLLGVPVGMFTGTLGLGVMAIVSDNK